MKAFTNHHPLIPTIVLAAFVVSCKNDKVTDGSSKIESKNSVVVKKYSSSDYASFVASYELLVTSAWLDAKELVASGRPRFEVETNQGKLAFEKSKDQSSRFYWISGATQGNLEAKLDQSGKIVHAVFSASDFEMISKLQIVLEEPTIFDK